jgi:hypothetical protein
MHSILCLCDCVHVSLFLCPASALASNTIMTRFATVNGSRVLELLGADLELFRSRRMKELRVAVNPLVEERMKQTAGAGLATAGMASLSGKVCRRALRFFIQHSGLKEYTRHFGVDVLAHFFLASH